MRAKRQGRARLVRWLGAGGVIGAGLLFGLSDPAAAATTASFSQGTLTVNGDGTSNTVTFSRNAAGAILVNGGAISVTGGTPTVANTALIQVFGQGGEDTFTLDESNGALPRANVFGGAGNDTLTGGCGRRHALRTRPATTRSSARAASTSCSAARDHDTATGGDADDQVFGESGNDRMIWNPGDDTDLNEGGSGTDTVEVNGGGGDEIFTTTANGTRVRFDRLDPAPFAIDIGTSENLVLNANGGVDSFSATGNLAALISITVDGGSGDDTILGSNGSTNCSAATATTSSTASRATTSRSWVRTTTPSSGTRATAATPSKGRTAPTRCSSTARAAPNASWPPPTDLVCSSPATSPTS